VESEAVLNVKMGKYMKKKSEKIGAVGDDLRWCFWQSSHACG